MYYLSNSQLDLLLLICLVNYIGKNSSLLNIRGIKYKMIIRAYKYQYNIGSGYNILVESDRPKYNL